MYTPTEIQSLLIELLKDSPLVRELSGKVFRAQLRPRDSQSEDLTVAVPSLDAQQRQAGFVRLTVFVPDLLEGATSVRRPDLRRCARFERLLLDWAQGLTTDRTGDLLLRPAEAPSVVASPDAPQHLVTFRLTLRSTH